MSRKFIEINRDTGKPISSEMQEKNIGIRILNAILLMTKKLKIVIIKEEYGE